MVIRLNGGVVVGDDDVFAAALPADRFPNVAWVGPTIVAGSLDERF